MKEYQFRLKPDLERYRDRLPLWLIPGQWYSGFYLAGYNHTHPWRVRLLEPRPGNDFVDLDNHDLEKTPATQQGA